jgi:hypothetical protein
VIANWIRRLAELSVIGVTMRISTDTLLRCEVCVAVVSSFISAGRWKLPSFAECLVFTFR